MDRNSEGAVMTALPHFLSTACIHDVHERCQERCTWCDEPCCCECHDGKPMESPCDEESDVGYERAALRAAWRRLMKAGNEAYNIRELAYYLWSRWHDDIIMAAAHDPEGDPSFYPLNLNARQVELLAQCVDDARERFADARQS